MGGLWQTIGTTLDVGLPEAGFRLTYCSNATLGRRDFYRQLCHALGLSPKATAAAVFSVVNEHVEDLGRERIHPVFLLDEAHLLRQDVLEHLHVLANYQWDQKPLLTLVLVGLPELWARLRLHKNRSLWSRIHCRVAIDDPAPEDTVEYVSYRLRGAGNALMGITPWWLRCELHRRRDGHRIGRSQCHQIG